MRYAEPLVSEGRQMIGPHGKGVSSTNANAPETHDNQHSHFANDDGARKAPEHESLLARLRHNAAEPSLRAVGDMLRGIGGRP